MGSSCSSAQKKKEKEKLKESQSPLDGGRRRSTESVPYGKASPPSSRRPSFEPTAAPLIEQVESPTVVKTPVNASLSQASTVGGSSSSPPPTGTTGTPVVKDAPSIEMIGLPNLQQFPDHVRNLLMGRLTGLDQNLPLPQLQNIMLYISADYNDSSVERTALAERVFPALRKYTAEKGYELNVTDLHWGISNLEIADHSFRDLCIDTLTQWKAKKRLISLVMFNDNVGEFLLPRCLPKPHFESALEAMSSDEDRNLFHKWYTLDENVSPAVFTLQPITALQPLEIMEDVVKKTEVVTQWQNDAEKMIQLLKEVLPDDQKNRHLSSALEEEIKALVSSDDPQEARRILWMQRRFTHIAKPTANSVSSDSRRIDRTKVQLEDFLPDTQKLVLYVRWSEEGIKPDANEEHESYITELCNTLKEELVKMVDAVLEEDFLDEAQTPYRGIEYPLFVELAQHYCTCASLSERFIGRQSAMKQIEDYVCGPSTQALVVYGPEGCGKTYLIADCVKQCSNWLPSAPVVVRLVGLTPESSSHKQLLRSILEQCCALYGEHPSVASESVAQDGSSGLERMMAKVSEARPLVVIVDGVDETTFGNSDFCWLPSKELPPHVKLVLTVREGSERLQQIKDLLKDEAVYMELEHVATTESMSAIDNLLQKRKRRLTDSQRSLLESALHEEPSARYAELVGEMAIRWTSTLNAEDISLEKTTHGVMLQYLVQAAANLGSVVLATVLGLLVSVKHGITSSEIIDILSCEEEVLDYVFLERASTVRRFPAVLWALAKRHLGPFLSYRVLGGRTLVTLSSLAYRTVAATYLKQNGHELKNSSQSLIDYFLGKWSEGKKKPCLTNAEKERYVLPQPLAYGSNPNRRKLDELPHQMLKVEDNIRDDFLVDATWLLYKFCGSDPYQFLEDISCYEDKTSVADPELKLLTSVVYLSSYALRCDGSQFFAQMYGRLKSAFSDFEDTERYPNIKQIYDRSCQPPLSSLLPIMSYCLRAPAISDCPEILITKPLSPTECSTFSGLYTIKDDNAHMVSLSSTKGEVTVWNIYEQSAVRKFVGVNQPKDIKMLDRYRALVLCNRELKVYHLDEGSLLVKLKGVMNQKMAYYGLHDDNYAVALSRNRMYVNMTNLTTGDLETTFKVGEDRFLNSLLVSANGRICVCGDETQKPFPLLVWDLSSRKLVYDLRIPHHEFVTRLSAISDDGHYVVSVCRELHDTSPNFIIVYDLQSGTLFKKWKPESSSCSIAISSQGGCVVNGLENTWVLVWDLSAGARRYTLRGHSAPVDEIRIEEEGNRCLTYDSQGRDRSVRVWDVSKGECLAVFTPDEAFSCCELSLDGRAVVLGLKGREDIVTLLLCQESSVDDGYPEQTTYGDEERKHKVFDMSSDGL